MTQWIVQIEPGVYLAEGDGDPARTMQIDNAKQFNSHPRARIALMSARRYRAFLDATVTLAPLRAALDGAP